jgi:hypothetical protein
MARFKYKFISVMNEQNLAANLQLQQRLRTLWLFKEYNVEGNNRTCEKGVNGGLCFTGSNDGPCEQGN